MKRLLRSNRTTLAAIVAAAAGVGALAFVAANMAFSDEGSGVVDFAKITPLPFVGYPTEVFGDRTYAAPTCQAAEGEREDPSLPPLSCRNSGAEPPPGAIKTASAEEIPDKTALAGKVPEGWTVIDNRLFRYTLAIPSGWYSTMRAEGGEFRISDPVVVAQDQKGIDLAGGVVLIFSAREYMPPRAPDGFQPDTETHLASPNFVFGGYAGALWEEPAGEGLANISNAAFARDGVVYEIRVHVGDGGRSPREIGSDMEIVGRILASIAPY